LIYVTVSQSHVEREEPELAGLLYLQP
jgi:hypothetical protein